jgi:hydrogenase maturation protein HypF
VVSAEIFVRVTEAEAAQLISPARPILVFPKLQGERLAPSIAPGLDGIGVLLPYTPLHYLLFHEAAGHPDGLAWLTDVQEMVLVMTSANPGGEPLVTDNAEAHRRLKGIADAIVTHDRAIVVRVDDSVQRFIGGAPSFIRRARGFVPQPVKLSNVFPSGLAVGAHLKNTVCVVRGDEAFVSQHIGDLDNPEALVFFEETVAHLLHITDVEPTWVAHDVHPDFHSTRFAQDFAATHGLEAVGVQHHFAHVAAVMAEHGLEGGVLGLALDGFGLGEKSDEGDAGTLNWGGEALVVDGSRYRRVGHLAPLPLPGGEAAFRAPWKIAAAVLHGLGRGDDMESRFASMGDVNVLCQMLDRGVNVQPSTSCGRLFDAAAGLLGVQPLASFDGQAPMKLEALVTEPEVLSGAWRIMDGVLDFASLLGRLADMDSRTGANVFHGTVTWALAEWALALAQGAGVERIVLSGGCMLNRTLAEGLERALRSGGVEVFRPRLMPPGDGAISLGQAYAAALTVQHKN